MFFYNLGIYACASMCVSMCALVYMKIDVFMCVLNYPGNSDDNT